MAKRVWKPLDVGGLRLYRVHEWTQDWERWHVVASRTPMNAAEIVEKVHKPFQ